MKQRWAVNPWAAEIKLLNRWALWCCRGDERTIKLLCGLTPAGSPHTAMETLWERGAVSEAEVTGYAREHAAEPDTDMLTVDAFMMQARQILPTQYLALVARHRRMVNGELIVMRSEQWIAQSLYGIQSRRMAWNRLVADCAAGYSALRLWLGNRARDVEALAAVTVA